MEFTLAMLRDAMSQPMTMSDMSAAMSVDDDELLERDMRWCAQSERIYTSAVTRCNSALRFPEKSATYPQEAEHASRAMAPRCYAMMKDDDADD